MRRFNETREALARRSASRPQHSLLERLRAAHQAANKTLGSKSRFDVRQVAVGLEHAIDRFNGARPVWTQHLVDLMLSMQARGVTLSPKSYPHAAEDVRLACNAFLGQSFRSRRAAVFSAISPWVELTLLSWGVSSVTTVDYNPPIVEARLPGMATARVLSQPDLASVCTQQSSSRFGLIVSFSGIEHDGLGRYGDPINCDGDLAAMSEMWACLDTGGILFLGIPTNCRDDDGRSFKFFHRIYGPSRLPVLLQGFDVLGWVWDGQVVRGNHTTFDAPMGGPGNRTIWCRSLRSCGVRRPWLTWQHQPVIALRKNSLREPRPDLDNISYIRSPARVRACQAASHIPST